MNWKITMRQILSWNVIQSVREFEMDIIQRVRFWNEMRTTCQTLKQNFCSVSGFEVIFLMYQILSRNFYNESDFKLKFLHSFRFFRKPCNQGDTFQQHLLNKIHRLCIFRAFSKNMILNFQSNNVSVLEKIKWRSVSFCVEKFKRVKFRIGSLTTRQILNYEIYIISDFAENYTFKISRFDSIYSV